MIKYTGLLLGLIPCFSHGMAPKQKTKLTSQQEIFLLKTALLNSSCENSPIHSRSCSTTPPPEITDIKLMFSCQDRMHNLLNNAHQKLNSTDIKQLQHAGFGKALNLTLLIELALEECQKNSGKVSSDEKKAKIVQLAQVLKSKD